jgi:hypothetical protein
MVKVTDFIKKFVPKQVWEKARNAVLYRAEDPNQMMQVMPQKMNTTGVERIQGYRFPAPGSRAGAHVPEVENEDDIYDIGFSKRNNLLVNRGDSYTINSSKGPVTVDMDKPRPLTHGKRKITLLPYDPSGLRTTKTITWESLDKVLAKNAAPDHLPKPAWWADRFEMVRIAEAKGLPTPMGKRYNWRTSDIMQVSN